MMKRLFHPPTLCLLLICATAFGQNWYSDDAFLSYYAPDEEIYLTSDFSHVDIYLHNELGKSKTKRLKKSKGFIAIDDKNHVIAIDLSKYADTDFSSMSKADISAMIDIPMNEIREVVPTMKVGGRIKSKLKNDFIISFKGSVNPNYLEKALERLNGQVKGFRPDGSYIIEMEQIKNGFDLMHELKGLDLIEYAQPDMIVKVQHTDDPLFAKQYQLNNTGQYIDGQQATSGIDLNIVPAWNITKGSGVTVAVIDDGIEAHEDLPQIKAGYTPADDSKGVPSNTGKHGMAVAGIISAQHNDLGVKGISPNADLIGVNIFAQGTSLSGYADAFYWAVDNGADVISNSWGFIYEDVDVESVNPPIYTVRKGAMCNANPFPALTSAINYAADNGRNGKGCIITFASGNWAQEGPLGQNSDECVTYPGSLDKVLAIGAVNPRGEKAIYSDYGPKLDFVAPSNDLNSNGSRSYFGVRTIDREGARGYSRSNYHSGFGGTSAATPAASGAIALILSAHPNLTRNALTDLLKRTAKDLNTSGFDIQTGHGLIDASAAIAEAGAPAPIDPCASKGGDSDGDGICDADDCNPNDAFYPARAGSACDDGDPTTANDKVTSSGCDCQGVVIACYNEGGDFDGDGYCLLDDCNDEDPNVPAAQGTPCNDNDPTTENDVIQADGCTCLGTLIIDETTENDNDTDNNEDNQSDPEEEVGCINPDNIALNSKVSQSSTFFTFSADRAVDESFSTSKYSQTNYSKDPYFDMDLGSVAELQKINILLKAQPRESIYVFVSEASFNGKSIDEIKNDETVTVFQINESQSEIDMVVNGRFVRLQTPGFQSLAIVEIEAYGCLQVAGFSSGQTADLNIAKDISINEISMKAYPNPTSSDAFVSFENALGKSGNLTIYNSLGIKIYEQSMVQIPIIPIQIDTDHFNNGMYIIEMISENQRITEKLVVNK